MKCRWCANPITKPFRGGSPSRYCSPACKKECESVSARYGAVMLDRGMVTPEAMRQATTPPPAANLAPPESAGSGGTDAA